MHVCCVYIRTYLISETDKYKIRGDKIPLGISYISSSLKQAGYTTEIIYCTTFTFNNGITKYIKHNPQVFAISITAQEDVFLLIKFIEQIKREYNNAKIIVGGPIVTIDTENIFKKIQQTDAICIGAGEKAIAEYVKQVEKGKYQKTDNLWIKDNNGHIIKCDRVLSIENLDELPYPDREGWNRWIIPTKNYAISINRGCIYNCTFCNNNILKSKSNNRYFQERSAENILTEIDFIVKEYSAKNIMLVGESAITNVDKFRRLCLALKNYNNSLTDKIQFEININFTPNLLNEDLDIIYLMKEANFKLLKFSLESGSYEIRKLLGKPSYQNKEIIEFFNILHKLNFNTLCWVIYCHPFETRKTYYETLDCLRQCKPTRIIYQILSPLKETQLYKKIVEEHKDKKFSIIDKYRFYTLKFRVYNSYKPRMVMLNIFLSRYKLFIILKKLILKYKQKNKFKIIQKSKKYFYNKKYNKAIKYFNKISIDKTNYWIYGDRGIAKMTIGDYKGAIKDFDKILELEPKEIYREKREECLNLLNILDKTK